MIVYVTNQTAERYKIDMSERMPSSVRERNEAVLQRESGDKMLEWGAKLFYFDRRKCLEVANFASKFTLFLVDVKVGDLIKIGAMMANYMFGIYRDDPEMLDLLVRYFQEAPDIVFSKLRDKSNLAHLNHELTVFALDGYRLYEFIEDGILLTRKFNEEFNKNYPVTRMIDGKKEYDFPANTFKELLKARYPKPRRAAVPRSSFLP